MNQALRADDVCIIGILDEQEKLIMAHSLEELQGLMAEYPQAILIFNQHQQALEIKDQIEDVDGQQHIEVFQDTIGVFGLRAYIQKGKIETPVTLEFDDKN